MKKFTKNDLKTGMIVKMQNGDKAMVLLGTENGDIFCGDTNWGPFSNYDCDLKSTIADPYDIVKVYQPCDYKLDKSCELILLWEREEENAEEELNKALKIVKDRLLRENGGQPVTLSLFKNEIGVINHNNELEFYTIKMEE